MSLKLRIRRLSVMVITELALSACSGTIPSNKEQKEEKKARQL